MKLFVRKIGDQGPAIVILHGLFGMSDNWLSIAKIFAENYTVYLPDLRNHGQSPHSNEFSYELMANDIAELLHTENIEDATLIGHSMGGKVLMNFVAQYPKLAKGIIIVDIAARFYPIHHHMILQGLHSINLSTLQSRTEANTILMRFEENEGVRQFLLKNLWRNPVLGHFDWRFNLEVLSKEISEIGIEQLPKNKIITPTLVIAGQNSSYVNQEDVIQFKQHYTQVSFAVVAGAGHWVQADQPQVFITTVLAFMAQTQN
jgi:esterase